MKPTELLALLHECYEQRQTMLLRHQAVARHVGDLDINNTYQYVIAREETHLSWLRDAIEDLGGVAAQGGVEPAIASPGAHAAGSLIREDAAAAARFVADWTPRIAAVTNARDRGMLRVILGETLEHERFFEQVGTAGVSTPVRAVAPSSAPAGWVTDAVTVAIALGSNLGDRAAHLHGGLADLEAALGPLSISPLIETAYVGAGQQPAFLNAAAVGRTVRSAREVLDLLLAIERRHGRARPYAHAPRTLDLDLILRGADIVDAPDLQVPHPRFRERAFVLEPLAAIAPDLRDPVTGLSVGEILSRLRAQG